MVPSLVQEMKSQGRNDDSILEMIDQKHNEGVVKYGNKSKIGLLLDKENKKMLDFQKLLQREMEAKKLNMRNNSEFNKAQIEELAKFRQKFQQVTGSQGPPSSSAEQTRLAIPAANEAWQTTQRSSYSNQ